MYHRFAGFVFIISPPSDLFNKDGNKFDCIFLFSIQFCIGNILFIVYRLSTPTLLKTTSISNFIIVYVSS